MRSSGSIVELGEYSRATEVWAESTRFIRGSLLARDRGPMAIEANAGILGGKPVIQGTRIPVDLLLELVDAGLSVDDIVSEYPHLKREDVLMVLQVARKGL